MKKSSRFIGATVMAGALVMGSVTVAHAATVKQGAACVKKGSKAKAGGIGYICQTNPTTTSTKLVWVSTDCIAADAAFKNTVTQMASFASQQTSALAQISASIDASKKLVDVLNQQINDAKTKKYIVGYDHSVKPAAPITAIGVEAAIAALNAKIATDTSKRDAAGAQRDILKATLAKTYTDAQIQSFTTDTTGALRNPDKNVQNYANWIRAYQGYDGGIANTQKNITNLSKILSNLIDRLAKAQAQVDSMTGRYETAKSQQPALLAQIQTNSKQANSFRAIACKAGL